MSGLADAVLIILELAASLAVSTLGEIVVGAALASPALFRELKAPSVSHALSHVLLDQISGLGVVFTIRFLLFLSFGGLGGGRWSEVRNRAHVHVLSLDRGSKGIILVKSRRSELIKPRCVLVSRPVIIV